MLKQFSRLERTRNYIIIGFAVMMAISLIIFYAPGSNRASTEPAKSTELLARVGGEDITVGDLATLKESYAQMFGSQFNLAQLGGDKRFLDGLIRDRVVAQEAARLGLAPSDAEVAEAIRKQFTDASGKFVGFDRYKEAVRSRYGDIERFERQMRDRIAQQKLEAFITAGVRVSDEEVQDKFKRENTLFDLVYVPVTAAKLAEKIQPTDEELRAYFEQHKANYNYLVPQKKIRYLFIDQEKAGQKLPIPEADLRAEFDQLKPENKMAGVRVQQIFLKVARPDLESSVRDKAERLVKELRGETGNVSEEKFAEYAKGNSEDPATAKTGGWLARPVKKNPTKPDALYERMVDLEEGAITDAIKYGGNWYIMRRGKAVDKTFEEAKPELLVSLRNRRAYAEASKLAQKAAERLKATKDYPKVAQELAAEANMKPAEMVKETPYIKPGDDVPGIGVMQQFEQSIAQLENPNDVGDRTPVKGGFAVPMLLDKREPRTPEFEEVREKVADAVKQERAKAQVEEKAKELAGGAATAGDLKAAAEKLGHEAKTEEAYKLSSPLGDAGTSPFADETIYALKAGELTKTPIKIGDNWVVVGVTKREEADLKKFATQRDSLVQTALSARRNQVYDDYINSVIARMKREGKIKVYQDVLDKMAEDEPAAAPPQMPRVPQPTK
jgi:peptidyl-prolyl cis-trans isomerase D